MSRRPREQTYTVQQVAQMYGKVPRTIYRWINTGKLRPVKKAINGELVIPQSAVDAYDAQMIDYLPNY